jgi:biuret amidohydrolase
VTLSTVGGHSAARRGQAGLAVPCSAPYPWPYDGAARADRTALLLVAVQAGVARLCPDAAAALGVMATVSAAAREWGAIVVATRHAASPAQPRPGVVPAYGQPPWELLAGLTPDAVVDAFGVDGFSGSPLAQCLVGQDVDHLLICGMGLEGPVHSTLRSANDRGLECLLVIDGCAPIDPNLADAAVRIIEMSGGIFGAVATGDVVVAAMTSPGEQRPNGYRGALSHPLGGSTTCSA